MAKPCADLHIEIAGPNPKDMYFVLDRDKLDNTTHLLAPDPIPIIGGVPVTPFTTDLSLLDGPDLIEMTGDTGLPAGSVWLDFTSKSMSISIDRRLDTAQSVVARCTAGTLAATIVDPYLDALAVQAVGLKSLVRVRVGSEPIFTGDITSLKTTYDAGGTPTVDLTAADGIAKLNSVVVPARPAETYSERVNAVAQVADLKHVPTTAGGHQTASDTQRTALETVFLAQDTEAGLCWIDRYNQLHSWVRTGDEIPAGATPDWVVTDDHTLPGHICGDAVQTGIETTQVINNLTVNNLVHDTHAHDPKDQKWTTERHEYTSPRSQRYYGVASVNVTTTMADADLTAYQSYVFTRFDEPHPKVTAVEYPTDDLTTPGIKPGMLVDLTDIVHVKLKAPVVGAAGIDYTGRVAGISHRLTPGEWTTQLALL